MKIRNIFFSFALAGLFFANQIADTSAAVGPSNTKSFSRAFKMGSSPKTTTKEVTVEGDSFEPVSTSKNVSYDSTLSGTKPVYQNETSSAAVAEESEDWGVFGLTPKPGRDGSMFPNPNGCTLIDGSPCTKPCPGKGSCKRDVWAPCTKRSCWAPCNDKKCAQKKPCPLAAVAPALQTETCTNYMTIMEDDVYSSIHHDCGDFAPVDLQWVDFRLQKGRSYGSYSDNLGKYRFRIFGCRRDTKDVMLNQGRTLQKDMYFLDVFRNATKGCLNLVKVPEDLCANPRQRLPEYILTAEITDFFMNVCDGYNWKSAERDNKRTGSAEITVVWRLMDLTKTNVLWKGISNGYTDVEDPHFNGEVMLVERAFADAVDNLRQQPGFEEQLALRVHPEDLARQRQALMTQSDPIKCQYQRDVDQLMAQQGKKVKYRDRQPEITKIIEKTVVVEETPAVPQDALSSYGTVIDDRVVEERVIEEGTTIVEESGSSTSTGEFVQSEELVDEYGNFVASGESEIIEVTETDLTIIEESGGSDSKGEIALVEEFGGSSGSGSAIEGKATSLIDEFGGGNVAAGKAEEFELKTICPISNDSFDSASGGTVSGTQEEAKAWAETVQGGTVANNVVTSGTCSVGSATGVIEENSDYWVEVKLTEESSDITDSNSLCIRDREPYDSLTPENLALVRKSIVTVTNSKGEKGSGLLLSDEYVLTSADLVIRDKNSYDISINGGQTLKARAFRINTIKNTALLVLNETTQYTPLSVSFNLPDVGKDALIIGLVEDNDGNNYIDNHGKVTGYRYTDDIGAEITTDTFVQGAAIGSSLFDKQGTVYGIAHKRKNYNDQPDLFLPIDTALQSLGLKVCDREFETKRPKFKPISEAIETNVGDKEPAKLRAKDKK